MFLQVTVDPPCGPISLYGLPSQAPSNSTLIGCPLSSVRVTEYFKIGSLVSATFRMTSFGFGILPKSDFFRLSLYVPAAFGATGLAVWACNGDAHTSKTAIQAGTTAFVT